MVWLLKLMLLFGASLVLVSRGRVSSYELSPSMTACGWIVFGVALFGLSIVMPADFDRAWRDLEILVRLVAAACGVLTALLAMRKLRGLARLGPDPARYGRSQAVYRRGWRFTYVGLGMLLGVAVSPGIKERTIDSSPASLALLAVLVVGVLCLARGYALLARNHQ